MTQPSTVETVMDSRRRVGDPCGHRASPSPRNAPGQIWPRFDRPKVSALAVNTGKRHQPARRRWTATIRQCCGRSDTAALLSVYGKSPVWRQGIRLNGCVTHALGWGAAVASSEKVDRPQRQRPRGHTVGQSNTDPPTGAALSQNGNAERDSANGSRGAKP
jgi:hypothetical protein